MDILKDSRPPTLVKEELLIVIYGFPSEPLLEIQRSDNTLTLPEAKRIVIFFVLLCTRDGQNPTWRRESFTIA